MTDKIDYLRQESAFDFFDVLKFRKYLKGHRGYIAGGCFKNIFKKEDVKDIDVFFETENDFIQAEELFTGENEKYIELYRNENAVGFLDKEENIAIDLVKSMFLPPGEMISLFDFTITKFALFSTVHLKEKIDDEGFLETLITEEEWNVVYHEDFFKHLLLNRLVIDRDDLEFTLNTFDRMLRYSKYGYAPCTGTKIKVARAINQSNLPRNDEDLFRGFYHGID